MDIKCLFTESTELVSSVLPVVMIPLEAQSVGCVWAINNHNLAFSGGALTGLGFCSGFLFLPGTKGLFGCASSLYNLKGHYFRMSGVFGVV